MSTLLKWRNRCKATELRVYVSTATFDVDTLPAVKATLGNTITEYRHTDGTNGTTYYYGVAAVDTTRSPEAVRLSTVVSFTYISGVGGGSSPAP